jgi:hypothetical protein
VGIIVSALVALPLYQKMRLNPEPILKVIRDIGRDVTPMSYVLKLMYCFIDKPASPSAEYTDHVTCVK